MLCPGVYRCKGLDYRNPLKIHEQKTHSLVGTGRCRGRGLPGRRRERNRDEGKRAQRSHSEGRRRRFERPVDAGEAGAREHVGERRTEDQRER